MPVRIWLIYHSIDDKLFSSSESDSQTEILLMTGGVCIVLTMHRGINVMTMPGVYFITCRYLKGCENEV